MMPSAYQMAREAGAFGVAEKLEKAERAATVALEHCAQALVLLSYEPPEVREARKYLKRAIAVLRGSE